MAAEIRPGRPTTRRYSGQEKGAAVLMVRQLRQQFNAIQGAGKRVATQLG